MRSRSVPEGIAKLRTLSASEQDAMASMILEELEIEPNPPRSLLSVLTTLPDITDNFPDIDEE
ncbi:hypothetical protein ACL6C3_15960 [Capilliphycus salinus ALCB114379]|uniref:hypothetical protein n=1 Tax=Capilliphycus salinus TaxID=2768948 RepID=UPI0039A6B8A7